MRLVIVPCCCALVACQPVHHTAGFWFEDDAIALPPLEAAKIGGPLTVAERESIERTARDEVAGAFSAFDLVVDGDRRAFWRVRVMQEIEPWPRALPSSGESRPLGPLGGVGAVDFAVVSTTALRFAPSGAPRAAIVDAIGRGLGRVAAHEFGHQILGGGPHNDRDENSYEFGSPDRAARYYGRLQWTTWRAPLEAKLGARVQ